jgi:ketosteroid isomerase-like protein
MKKLFIAVIALIFIGGSLHAQKKNGTIYSEHEAIDKTKGVWEAIIKGDKDKYMSFFADSVYMLTNGFPSDKVAIKDDAKNLGWLNAEFENIKVEDQKPAYPDALEYKGDVTWVQDWLIMTGRHIKTGIHLELPIHCLYNFNSDGKITVMSLYFDDDIFEEINNSLEKKLNGKVFIYHPYIVTVRKLMNAYVDGDLETWKGFFAENAVFYNTMTEWGKYRTLEEIMPLQEMQLKSMDKFKVEQVGYPDCIYYEKGGLYVVYSWWTNTIVKNGKPYTYPFMLTHNFNDEGKIVVEYFYGSSNHME